jgi:ferredoxin-NADP reductase
MGKFQAFVDKLFASLSMYLGVALALFSLFGVALTLSFLGMLSFRPVDMILIFSLFLIVCYGASYVFAYLFSVKAHHTSALITGSILFFLFSPVLSLSNVIIYGLIAVIAIASKYLLVWRGRHLFNPAAIAAVIISFTGLQFASWWGASMILAIPATLFGLVVLYKTRRLQLAGVFLTVYILAIVGSAAISGVPIHATLEGTLGAWWPFFFAGFMLCEPLALPPRRYQYLIVAAFVGLLIGVHPKLGAFYVTPEIALAGGNLLAFVFSRRTGIVLKLVKRQVFPGEQEMYEFTPKRPLHFKAGQYMEVTLPHAKADLRGERRMFTISSAPESPTVRITTRYAEKSSTFKSALRTLEKGHEITATAVRGDFILPKGTSEKLLFIAGGIGITPFRAHLESLQLSGEKRDIVLVYAARGVKEVLFDELLADKNVVKTIVIAPDARSSHEGSIKAKVVDDTILKKAVGDIAERTVYISGPPGMVAALRKTAQKLGATRIRTDDFTGY